MTISAVSRSGISCPSGSFLTSASFARLVRNVYKVLLTRGMSGTIIYSTDEQTRAALCASRRQLT